MPDGASDRHVLERRPGLRAAQEQSAAAHVATTGEGGREEEAFTKDVEEWADVLVGGDAAKQHDAVVGTDSPVECGRIANEGVPKRGLGFINRHRRHLLQIFDANQHIGWKETAPRRDDECPAESTRIRELPAEVETAHEGE